MSELRTYPFRYTVNKLQQINTTTIRERLGRGPQELFQPHRTDFFHIYLITDGKGSHMVDFDHIAVEPNHILFISQGQVHAFDPNGSYDGKALIFTADFFCRTESDKIFLESTSLFNNFFCQSYFRIGKSFDKLCLNFTEIFDELRNTLDDGQSEILHNLLYRILLLSQQEIEQQMGIRKKITASDLLAINFKQEVYKSFKIHKNTGYYADLLNVSVRRLQMATSMTFNKTPKQLIHDRILLEAKRVLAYDVLSVKEVASELGFEETTNFVKFFKHKSGLTPKNFKSSL